MLEGQAMHAIIDLQNNERFQSMPDHVKTGVIECIKRAIEESKKAGFTEKEIIHALRYLVHQHAPHLLDRSRVEELDNNRSSYDPFYFPSNALSWDLSLPNILLICNHYPNPVLYGDPCGGNSCEGESAGIAVLLVLAVGLICSGCVCLACSCGNTCRTVQSQERARIKLLKLLINSLSFVSTSTASFFAFYSGCRDHRFLGNHAIFWFLALAISFTVGASATALISWVNAENLCYSKSQIKESPDQNLLNELSEIPDLLSSEWLKNKGGELGKEFTLNVIRTLMESNTFSPDRTLALDRAAEEGQLPCSDSIRFLASLSSEVHAENEADEQLRVSQRPK